MKILLIHQYFLEKGDGGGSRFNEMTQVWAEQGHEITILAGMVHYATGKKIKRYKKKLFVTDKQFYKNVDVIRCHVSESYNKSFIGRVWAYFSFVISSIYAGLFKIRKKHDVILVTSPPLFVGITAYVLSFFKRIPFIFEIRDLWPESAIDTGVLKSKIIIKFAFWFERFIYKRAKLINVLTPAFRDKLINNKKVPKEKIILIPNAADFTLAKQIAETLNVESFRNELQLKDKFVLTYVGAHGIANHLIQLIDAAEQLTDTNVVFQLIGDGMHKKMLEEEVKKRNLNNVIFRKPVSKKEVFKYIYISDMGISALKNVETFKTIYSNKTFDYMSCKKPILMLIGGVSKQLLEDSKSGMYVEPENTEALVKSIKKLLTMDEETLEEMGENGFQYAKKHFDRKKLAKLYIEKAKEIL